MCCRWDRSPVTANTDVDLENMVMDANHDKKKGRLGCQMSIHILYHITKALADDAHNDVAYGICMLDRNPMALHETMITCVP